ncbi:MAG: FAD-binding oxidoreductase [Steroidobacteraceae bacterium]
MKRREFVGAGLSLAATWPLEGWSAVLENVGDVAAKSLDGADLTIPGSSVEDFAASLRGDLLLRGRGAYDARRRVWNGMFDRKPALIACCTGTADVRRAVDFAREHRLLTAVRSGGHSVSGKSTCDGGLVIDLQSMQGVRVDPAMSRAFVEAGSMLGLLDHESAAFGLATTAGIVSHTGAAGLTLGGGFGRLGRRFGLACDNALAFDVVTADGHFLRATEEENTDLLWGLRGGGGNFGVVTAIDYRVHRMDPVIFGGYLGWPIAEARDVMRSYRDAMPSLPEELYVECALVWEKDAPAIAFEVCWSGDRARADEMVKPLRALGKPVYDDLAPIRYADMQTYSDESLAFGKRYYSKSGFLEQLTDDGIDLVIDVFQREPNLFVLFFDPVDGAYHRVAADATAFPHRGAAYWMGLVSVWQDAQASEARIEKIRSAWRELEPLARGFYTNLASPDESLAAYRENYGANLERLIALKAKYDPTNLFRLNANVPPKA